MEARHTFEIRYGFWKPLLWLVGAGPRQSRLAVEDDTLVVCMGWAFRASVPLASIVRADHDQARLLAGIGVHGWAGTWTVNGALSPMVAIDIEPAARARLFGLVGLSLRRLRVSVDDPDRVVATLSTLARR